MIDSQEQAVEAIVDYALDRLRAYTKRQQAKIGNKANFLRRRKRRVINNTLFDVRVPYIISWSEDERDILTIIKAMPIAGERLSRLGFNVQVVADRNIFQDERLTFLLIEKPSSKFVRQSKKLTKLENV